MATTNALLKIFGRKKGNCLAKTSGQHRHGLSAPGIWNLGLELCLVSAFEGTSKFFQGEVTGNTFVSRCWYPPKLRHFLEHESGKLMVIRLICLILNQLQSNRVGKNKTGTAALSSSASQIVYSISCHPAGVRKVDGINCLKIKSGKPGRGSCVRAFTLRCPNKCLVEGLALPIPAWSVVSPMMAWN